MRCVDYGTKKGGSATMNLWWYRKWSFGALGSGEKKTRGEHEKSLVPMKKGSEVAPLFETLKN